MCVCVCVCVCVRVYVYVRACVCVCVCVVLLCGSRGEGRHTAAQQVQDWGELDLSGHRHSGPDRLPS